MSRKLVLRAVLNAWPPSVGDFVTVGVYRDIVAKQPSSDLSCEIARVYNQPCEKSVYIKVLGGEVEFKVGEGLTRLFARIGT